MSTETHNYRIDFAGPPFADGVETVERVYVVACNLMAAVSELVPSSESVDTFLSYRVRQIRDMGVVLFNNGDL